MLLAFNHVASRVSEAEAGREDKRVLVSSEFLDSDLFDSPYAAHYAARCSKMQQDAARCSKMVNLEGRFWDSGFHQNVLDPLAAAVNLKEPYCNAEVSYCTCQQRCQMLTPLDRCGAGR